MSDIIAIQIILASLALMTVAVTWMVRRIHQRCDDIATGLVNGTLMSTRYRWLLLFQDYVANAFGAAVLLFVFTLGFLATAEIATNPIVSKVAYFSAAGAGWSFLGVLIFAASWVLYLASILRQAEAG
jgi:hypothetical protein